MIFPRGYPFKPPRFILFTQIFHPNISENGYVSIDILQNLWTPLYFFHQIILSIQSLLDDPNPDDFLNEMAAKLYKENKIVYEQTVRKYTSQFANYSKFQEDCKKLNIKKKTIKEGETIK